jgi:FixJ family two-component response regulator
MTMPHMSGDLLALELKRIRPDLPVILCTGYSKKITEEAAAKMGIKAFIYKPIEKHDLARVIRNVLDNG